MTDNPDVQLLNLPGVSVADFRDGTNSSDEGDRRDGKFYRYTPDVKLAVRVALAVNRPLLVFGPSGCGKSSLVFNIARLLRRRYYEFVVSSRSEASDLYYRFDAVRRLGEAQIGAAGDDATATWRDSHNFIEPGPLWWVYSAETARRRGTPPTQPVVEAVDPGRWPDDFELGNHVPEPGERVPPAVLLIDEIDKADPDFPNNLLVPLGSRQFKVDETGDIIQIQQDGSGGAAPLVVITSNRERELPAAFVRRCIVLEIKSLDNKELVDLARMTFPQAAATESDLWQRIAESLQRIRAEEQVSPAEYLDTIVAIRLLHAKEEQWADIILRTAWTSTAANRQ